MQTGKLSPYLDNLKVGDKAAFKVRSHSRLDPSFFYFFFSFFSSFSIDLTFSALASQGPFPKFKYQPSALEQGIAIAGGSGITPMYQLISHSLGVRSFPTLLGNAG